MAGIRISFPHPPNLQAIYRSAVPKLKLPKMGMPRTSRPFLPRKTRYSPALNKKNL
jgi:hypothetical protein